jgi:hypothetical protein
MAISISTGTVVAIASTYGTAVNMTALTNAAEAVATLAVGHSVVVGDYLEVTSGWGRLDKRIVRVKTVATNDVTFEGINTTSTTLYPAGAGTGTIRRITNWTDLTQLQGVSLAGGEQQFTDITTIADVVQKQAPTTRSPFTMTITAFYDAALAWWSTVRTAGDTQALTAVRVSVPSGTKTVANAYWSLAEVPNIEPNAPLTHQVVCAFAVAATPYAT